MAPLSAALDRGHDVLNGHDELLYSVRGEHAGYAYPTAERLAAHDWHPGLFAERAWNAGTRLGTAGLAGLDRAIGAAVAPATADPKG